MIEFAWPELFYLLPIPLLIYIFVPKAHKIQSAALIVPDLQEFEGFNTNVTFSLPKLKGLFLFLIWGALIAAAARPQWIGEGIEIPQSGRDLMLAVDLSGSMQLADFEINGQYVDRLTALKWIAGDFIERRKGDRLGLILFGSHAYVQTPLTFDTATVKQLLMESAVGLAGNETAMGDAIALAVKQLKDSPQESRVLILLTDGNNNAGELKPEKAAEIASHHNLKIYTVAIGSNEVMVHTPFGTRRVSSEIDEKTLKMVADKTGGSYFRAYNTKELVQIYQHIDRVEKMERSNKFFRPIDEMYFWPLLAALIISSGLFLLRRRL